MPRCPACRTEVKPRDENPAFPFCSARCREIDLGNWFVGSYRVPGPPAAEALENPPRDEDEEQ